MQEIIDDISVFYQRHIGEGTTVVLLHGWGASLDTMATIYNYLAAQNRSVISIDLPAFGRSSQPPAHFGVYEYANLVEKFLAKLGLNSVILLGHSFGGRLSILLASRTKIVSRLVLVDSAGMKPRRGISYYIKVRRYKRAKRKNKDLSGYGSKDYQALSADMKQVFTRVVNQFLEGELRNIACPTLIINGKNDTDTPPYMARRLRRGIRDSGLIILENCGHFSFLDSSTTFNIILKEFIKE